MADDPRVTPSAPRQNPPGTPQTGQAGAERNKQVAEAEDKRRKAQEEANQQAAEVMEKSKPWPTQELADKIKLGIATEEDMQPPDNPEMPPLHEQHAKRDEAEKRRK